MIYMTLSDAVLRSLIDIEKFVEKGPFAKHSTVRLVNRADVFAHGDTGEVVSSNREYTMVRIGGVQQIVRTSQLRGRRNAEVISLSHEQRW